MNRLTDPQLLRDYTERHSEAAFTELVRRHVDLVYSAALRMVCDAHLAEDVTQGAFVALAQNARQLTAHPVLSGWLHRTAQNLAAKAVRSDVRRRAREQEAATMNELLSAEPDAAWEHIAPHLDAALGELGEADRDALLLRYFERKSASEMAQTLGISDEAAQKRVTRAVERLREFFAKRGLTVGASGLVVVITANAVQAAPVGLAVTISTAAALAGTTIAATATATAIKTIAMTTLQKTVITATLAAAVGTGIYEARQASSLRTQVQALQQQQAEQIQGVQSERLDSANRLSALVDEIERVKGNSTDLLKLRGEVTRLRREANDPMNTAAKSWQTRINQLKNYLAQHPEGNIPEFQFLYDRAWVDATSGKLETETDYRMALARLRQSVQLAFGDKMSAAMQKYLQANKGQIPTDLSQLQPYFDPPVSDEILQRWEILPIKEVPSLKVSGGDWIITQKAPVDDEYDSRVGLGPKGLSTTGSQGFAQDLMARILRSFAAANNGQPPSDPAQLLPFATTATQKSQLERIIKQFNGMTPSQRAEAQRAGEKLVREILSDSK
ncbi:MAG: RNA polymerase sigma factor [Verrucomicrobia bacterium]|nr:RNA polymerase sigma factor [Verrucomicrobiota bacterium]